MVANGSRRSWSGGEQQRVALGRALVREPRAFLMDRIAVLDHGRIQQVGTPEEIYDRPVNRFVATFVGSSRMNLLPCHRDGGSLAGQDGWRLPAPPLDGPGGTALELGVRPEDLVVDGSRPDLPVLEGRVYAVEPLGDRSLVDVEIGDTVIRVKAPPAVGHEIDDVVKVGVDLDRAHLFHADTGLALRPDRVAAS